MKEKIVWESKNGHIIIIKRKSFFNDNDVIYCIYKEKRNYSRFNSYKFYDVKWILQRWEYNLKDAINYTQNIEDNIIID